MPPKITKIEKLKRLGAGKDKEKEIFELPHIYVTDSNKKYQFLGKDEYGSKYLSDRSNLSHTDFDEY